MNDASKGPPSEESDWETNSSRESTFDEGPVSQQNSSLTAKSNLLSTLTKSSIKDASPPSNNPDIVETQRAIPLSKHAKAMPDGDVLFKKVDEVSTTAKQEKTSVNTDVPANKMTNKSVEKCKATRELEDFVPDVETSLQTNKSLSKVPNVSSEVATKENIAENRSCVKEGDETSKEVVVKKIIKVKKKKLKPKIDIIETSPPDTAVVDSIVSNPGIVADYTDKSKIASDEFSCLSKRDNPLIHDVVENYSSATFGIKEVSLKDQFLTTFDTKLSSPVFCEEKGKHLEKENISSQNERGFADFENLWKPQTRMENVCKESSFLINGANQNLSSFAPYSGHTESKALDKSERSDEFKHNDTSRGYSSCSKNFTENGDDDDIVENITKYLSKKFSKDVEPISNKADDYNREDENEDSDSEFYLEKNILSSKKHKYKSTDMENGKGEAFMDQVRRERNLKSTRQRNDSLFQPKRRGETDERVAEKTKHVRALIDKQVVVVDNLRSSIQRFAELETLVKDLKAESLEYKADLENMEDLFDIIYNKYKKETATADEALRMQRKEKKTKVNKNDLSHVLREFFEEALSGRFAMADERTNNKADEPLFDFSNNKNHKTNKFPQRNVDVFPSEKNTYPDFEASSLPATKDFSDKFLAKSRPSTLNKQADVGIDERTDKTSLSAEEFIERIRNKYAIVSPNWNQKMTSNLSHPQRVSTPLDKLTFLQLKSDSSEGNVPEHRKGLLSKTSNQRVGRENIPVLGTVKPNTSSERHRTTFS